MGKRRPLQIPPSMTLEELEAATAEYQRRKRREYAARHPDVIDRQRDRAAAARLKRRGYIVLPMVEVPPGDPWTEWDELTIRGMADALRAAVAEAREAVGA